MAVYVARNELLDRLLGSWRTPASYQHSKPIRRSRGRSSAGLGDLCLSLLTPRRRLPVNAPYHRPVSTRHSLSDSKVTSTRLSEIRASCRASWQSPSSSVQCFHWDRLYSAMSVGIGDDGDRQSSRRSCGGGRCIGRRLWGRNRRGRFRRGRWCWRGRSRRWILACLEVAASE